MHLCMIIKRRKIKSKITANVKVYENVRDQNNEFSK